MAPESAEATCAALKPFSRVEGASRTMDTRTISVGAYSGVERDSKLLPSFMGSLTETVSLSTFSKERDLLVSFSAANAGTARLKIIAKTRIQEASRFQDVGWDIFFTLLISSGTNRGPTFSGNTPRKW